MPAYAPVTVMQRMLVLQRRIEAFTGWCGRTVAWLSLAMMLLITLVIVLRYLFNLGWIAMQETVLYLHAALFSIAAAYTLKCDAHVRVDIFYRKFSVRGRALVNLLGTLLLLIPAVSAIGVLCWDYVAASWRLLEASHEAGGLPAVFLLKSLILVMVSLLLLQALAEVIKHAAILIAPEKPSVEKEDRHEGSV